MGNLTVKESGEMVNFISPNVSKITSFKVHFSPKQEGTGDPSPDNVREITGWNGVEGYKCGKNLVPWISTRYICTADHYNGNADWSELWEIPKRISYTYSVFIDNSNCNTASAVRVWLRDIDNSKYTHYVTGEKINAGEKGFSTVTLDFSNLPNDYYAYWGLNLYQNAIASMPIVYESDQETAIISDWSSNIGTIYGGYVDLISGELVADNAIKTFDGSETWNIATVSSKTAYQTRRPADITSGAVFTSNIITRVASLSGTVPNNVGYFGGTYLNVYAPSLSLEEWTAMLTATPLQIIYKLAEPITHQLTPQQLSTLKGQNNFWSNADYIEIEYELTETFDIQKAKRKIILNQPHVESASGDIVTFDTDMKGKLKECKVYFSPVQEGEGDPSPDNVRNITGWNGVTATRCGKNLIDKTAYENIYTTYDYIDSSYRCKKIQLKPNTTYTVSFTSTGVDANVIILFNYTSHVNGNTFLDLRKASGSKTYTTDDTGCLYIGSVNTNNDKYNARMSVCEIQIEEGLTATDYEPYTGQTYPITFPTEAGTVYGGYIDPINGELVATHEAYVFNGTENITSSIIAGYNRFSALVLPNVSASHLLQGWCSHLVYSAEPVRSNTIDLRICCYINRKNLYWRWDAFETVDAMKAYLAEQYANGTPMTVVCKLAEPIHYQLTPQQILTLKGINNVYSDTNGQMEIKYWKH